MGQGWFLVKKDDLIEPIQSPTKLDSVTGGPCHAVLRSSWYKCLCWLVEQCGNRSKEGYGYAKRGSGSIWLPITVRTIHIKIILVGIHSQGGVLQYQAYPHFSQMLESPYNVWWQKTLFHCPQYEQSCFLSVEMHAPGGMSGCPDSPSPLNCLLPMVESTPLLSPAFPSTNKINFFLNFDYLLPTMTLCSYGIHRKCCTVLMLTSNAFT